MKVQAGNYYRRMADDAIVKVLHEEVYPYYCSCGALSEECEGNPVVVYRLREGEWPTRAECMEVEGFEANFEPLDNNSYCSGCDDWHGGERCYS